MPFSSQRRLSDFTEFRLIQDIQRRLPDQEHASLLKGIGDDAAIIQSHHNEHWLISTDVLVEGTHFDLKLTSFQDMGYRAGIANLSDIAAMGGIPRYVLTTLAIPPHYSLSDIRAMYRGLLSSCHEYKIHLIGGDTSASKKGMFLGITILGTVERSRALLRGGAQIGDKIFTTGTLGDSWAGLKLLQSRSPKTDRPLGSRVSRFLINRHLRPTARIDIGRWLSTHQLATAAIDLSDGLSGDLAHLCRESSVGALIDASKIPISPQCRTFARHQNLDPTTIALEGGEDFELLFTVPESYQHHVEKIGLRHGAPITSIGTIESRKFGMKIKFADGSTRKIQETSFDHFRKKKKHSSV